MNTNYKFFCILCWMKLTWSAVNHVIPQLNAQLREVKQQSIIFCLVLHVVRKKKKELELFCFEQDAYPQLQNMFSQRAVSVMNQHDNAMLYHYTALYFTMFCFTQCVRKCKTLIRIKYKRFGKQSCFR